MFQNKIYLGAGAGVAATIAKDILNQSLYHFKLINTLFAQYAVGMYVNPAAAKSWPGIIAGYFIDFGLSALLGVIFVCLLRKTRPNHLIFQGFIFGSALYMVIYGLLISLGVTSVKERGLVDAALMILCHFTYGIALGLFVQKFGKKILPISRH